jgi:lipopolysaccharide transport system ATP-binding protein
MNSNIAIEFENVGKQYRLGLVGTGSLQHDINRWWQTTILRKEDPYLKIGEVNDRSTKGHSDYVWALKDISFKVEQGDVVGIIGKNGAGKSTLLKLLSHITAPTTGHITYRGRIASLLEVGTGFHPEMTARENIYMNGSIMGMTRQEITRKLDEIVDFAGIERYIDTPVKRFSSGMTVRLGFAVAAFLEPEILVVDEVLAVGDAEFQKKAIGKMKDVSQGGGRTVLFVSHNMTAVKALCKKGIILENGTLKESGQIDDIVAHYLRGDSEIDNHKEWTNPEIKKEGFELLEIGVRKKGGDWNDTMRVDQELELVVRYRVTQPYEQLHLTFHMKNEQGQKMFSFGGGSQIGRHHEKGEYKQTCCLPANFFNWGNYALDLYVVKNKKDVFIVEDDIISFTLSNRELAIGSWMGKEPGDITPCFLFSEATVNAK